MSSSKMTFYVIGATRCFPLSTLSFSGPEKLTTENVQCENVPLQKFCASTRYQYVVCCPVKISVLLT